MEQSYRIRGRDITPGDLDTIRGLVVEHWTEGRTVISRLLCERWNWLQPNGPVIGYQKVLSDIVGRWGKPARSDRPDSVFAKQSGEDCKKYTNSIIDDGNGAGRGTCFFEEITLEDRVSGSREERKGRLLRQVRQGRAAGNAPAGEGFQSGPPKPVGWQGTPE